MAKMSKMMKAFEKSPMDKNMDKAGAKKSGMSVKKWENSKADDKADKKALPAFMKGMKKGK